MQYWIYNIIFSINTYYTINMFYIKVIVFIVNRGEEGLKEYLEIKTVSIRKN